MAVPGKGIRIAGQDYCSYETDDTNDLDLGPGGLKVINANGGPYSDNQGGASVVGNDRRGN